jgi:hypothetical protein
VQGIAAIDAVHGVPAGLPLLPVKTIAAVPGAPSAAGGNAYDEVTGEPLAIHVAARCPCPATTVIHETGHFLDHRGLGGPQPRMITDAPRAWAGLPDGVSDGLQGWWLSIEHSAAYQQLQDLRQNPMRDLSAGRIDVRTFVPVDYLLEAGELWARSYCEYVARKSGDPVVNADLDDRIARTTAAELWVPEYWTSDDFSPIIVSIDRLFGALGWFV